MSKGRARSPTLGSIITDCPIEVRTVGLLFLMGLILWPVALHAQCVEKKPLILEALDAHCSEVGLNAATFRLRVEIDDLPTARDIRLVYSGTAIRGVDYDAVDLVTLESGTWPSTVFSIYPRRDSLLEGDETVIVSIDPNELGDCLAPPNPRSQTLIIQDDLGPIAPILSYQPPWNREITRVEGESVAWSVQALARPPPSYQWRVNGIPLEGQTNAEFVIPILQLAHEGFYDVLVTNSVGTAASPSSRLRVISDKPQVFLVTNTSDQGPGSLRQAIEDADRTPSRDTIRFQIPSLPPVVIPIISELPTIRFPIEIDARGVESEAATVVLDGELRTGSGITLGGEAGGSTIRGLALTRFTGHGLSLYGPSNVVEACEIHENLGSGILIYSIENRIGSLDPQLGNSIHSNSRMGIEIEAIAHNNQIIGNRIGSSIGGHNAYAGIWISGGRSNRIGGREPGSGNKIIGNGLSGIELVSNAIGNTVLGNDIFNNGGAGILMSGVHQNQVGGDGESDRNYVGNNVYPGVQINQGSTENRIQGNWIGLDRNGQPIHGYASAGILISSASGNLIGGRHRGEGNVISGNRMSGIEIQGQTSRENRIQGNRIGLSPTGIRSIPNSYAGVFLWDTTQNQIGGSEAGAGNLISGNGLSGIELSGGSHRNQVRGNLIGLDVTGLQPAPNQAAGILLSSASDNQIGGALPGEGNVISGNRLSGINLNINPTYGGSTRSNQILGNFIGTSASGEAAIPNLAGVLIYGDLEGNLVGGSSTGAGNLISGNSFSGIEINGNTSGIQIQGNKVGTDVSGSLSLPNRAAGILITSARDTLIGGAIPGAGNLISGNGNSGIEITGGASSNRVVGNFIGTDTTGFHPLPNGQAGVFLSSASRNSVGGAAPGEGNLISGNVLQGVQLNINPSIGGITERNQVLGNLIGLAVDGVTTLGNLAGGILLSGTVDRNNIGGEQNGAGNTISGNQINGIELNGRVTNTRIVGNRIGLTADGLRPAPNIAAGILLSGFGTSIPSLNRIGTLTAGGRNYISANRLSGIEVRGRGLGNIIEGNRIGLDEIGSSQSGNAAAGIFISQESDPAVDLNGLTIRSNTIAYNGNAGVEIQPRKSALHLESTGVSVRQNSIFSNGRIGIDLGAEGSNANDPSDSDTGANGLMNHPNLTEARLTDTQQIQIKGILQVSRPGLYFVDLFRNDACSVRGAIGNQEWIGTSSLSLASAGGPLSVEITLSNSSSRPLLPGDFISATATDDAGNTSEYSPCLPIGDTARPPSLALEPQDITVTVGETAQLWVITTGSHPLTYQWFKNEEPIPDSNRALFELVPHPEQISRFHVVVSNSVGIAVSRRATVRTRTSVEIAAEVSELPRSDFWTPDGEVHALAIQGDTLWVGGAFSGLVPRARGATMIDRLDGTQELPFPAINGVVRCALPDEEGGYFLGGLFATAGGFPRTNLVHVLANRQVDPRWVCSTDGEVLALTLIEDRLYVGGQFTQLNSAARAAHGAVTASAGELLPWSLDIHAPGEPVTKVIVRAMAQLDERIFLGGNFGVAASDGLTSGTPAWLGRLDKGAAIANGEVMALAAGSSQLYVSGNFETAGGQPRTNLVAFDAASGTVLPWEPRVAGRVQALEFVCDTVILAGDFDQVSGVPRRSIAAVHPRSTAVLPWSIPVDGPITHLDAAYNTLFVSGTFSTVGQEPRSHLAAIDFTAAKVLAWSPTLERPANSLLAFGRSVLVGGASGSLRVPRRNLAAIDLQTGRPRTDVTDADGPVRTLRIDDDTLYIGGDFTEFMGVGRSGAAALALSTLKATSWDPQVRGSVRALEPIGDRVFVGGNFLTVGDLPRRHLAAVDSSRGALLGWTATIATDRASTNTFGPIEALAIYEGRLYMGGRFDRVNGIPRTDLAAVDVQTGLLTDWTPVVQADPANQHLSAVRSLQVRGNTLWVAGDFFRTPTFGDWRGGLAAFDLGIHTLLPWNPWATWSDDTSMEIHSLDPGGEQVWIGGRFGSVYGARRGSLARVDASGLGVVLPWSPSANDTVNVIRAAGRQVIVGGRFSAIGKDAQPFLVCFQPKGAPVVAQEPEPAILSISSTLELEASASGIEPLTYQWIFEDAPLAGQTNRLLRLTQAQLEHSGLYRVVASNALGLAVSRDVKVQVVDPVKILRSPAPQVLAPGSSLRLSVQATGTPAPIYQWRLNGQNIPGADRPEYVIPNAHPTNSGSYHVIVANSGSALASEPVAVVISSPALPFSDAFADAGVLVGANGLGSTTNATATREPDERIHAGKYGGKSIWARWTAPADGIATFSTRGSAFDTLLAIYTGSSVSNLVQITEDEDQGGFGTSLAAFSARAGQQYWIAVDGYVLSGGHVVLSWTLDSTSRSYPQFLRQPLSQTVAPGQPVEFTVDVASESSVAYQWLLDCLEIPGATTSKLRLPQVRLKDVGLYSVRVRDQAGQTVDSHYALLEIGINEDVIFQDKLQDLFAEELLDLVGPRPRPSPQGVAVTGWASVPMGTGNVKSLGTTRSSTQPGETNHCGVIGGASKWFRLRVETPGVLALDTLGSKFDTVLAVYTLPGAGTLEALKSLADLQNLRFVACDDNSAPDGLRSVLRFDALPGVDYLVAVDGVGASQGMVTLNWRLGQVPLLSQVPVHPVINLGDRLQLRAGTTNVGPTPRYEWRLNRRAIPGATNAVWEIGTLRSTESGTYEVYMSNLFGVTTSVVAEVVAKLADLQVMSNLGPGRFGLFYPAAAPEELSLQVTENLKDWQPLRSFTPTKGTWLWEEEATTKSDRFFRVVPANGSQK